MNIRTIPAQQIKPYRNVKFTNQGNIIEIMGYEHKSEGNGIIKYDNDHYYNLKMPLFDDEGTVYNYDRLEYVLNTSNLVSVTGSSGLTCYYELYKYQHTFNRSQSPNELRKTFKRLRAIINTNVVDTRKCKFITLTYSENMTDPEQLKKDLANFNSRFKRYIKGLTDEKGINKGLDFEYISVCEPQGRGAWHAHIIYIFNKQIQFIDNNVVCKIWKNGSKQRGFTTTKKIDNVDNVGAYLTAYLADMPIEDNKITYDQAQYVHGKLDIKEKEVPVYNDFGEVIQKNKKRFIKGGRLSMYPPKFHIYRCSKGIKRPTSEYITYLEAMQRVGINAALTFSKSVVLESDKYTNTLTYEIYNKRRRRKRADSRTSYDKIVELSIEIAKDPNFTFRDPFINVDLKDNSVLNMLYQSAEVILPLEGGEVHV